jgi:hypothetical protein
VTVDPLFIDRYPGDAKGDGAAFCAAGPPWHGAVFKLSQGLDFQYAAWAGEQRKPFINSPRYGGDLFDGFYHYLTIAQDGAAQADRFMGLMKLIGGELVGTMWAMVDVERGGQRKTPNRQQVIDCVSAFAARYRQLSGRAPTLYGGELLRDLQVGSLMGCGRSWVALYGRELHGVGESTRQFLTRTGTDLDHLAWWQYDAGRDENQPEPTGYPNVVPGFGKSDISALTLPGGLARLRATLWAEKPA